jgi:hypothetical protein
MSFAKTFAEAKAKYKPMCRTAIKRSRATLKRTRMKPYRPSTKDRAWSKAVLDRDGHQCQWPGGCTTGDDRIDPHHKAERSQRPDLKHNVDVGLALCRQHHNWVPLHRAEAIAMGLLLDETYEAAQKRARLSEGTEV